MNTLYLKKLSLINAMGYLAWVRPLLKIFHILIIKLLKSNGKESQVKIPKKGINWKPGALEKKEKRKKMRKEVQR